MAYEEPTTKIKSEEDLQEFHKTPVFEEYISFLQSLNESMLNKVLSAECTESEVYFIDFTPIYK